MTWARRTQAINRERDLATNDSNGAQPTNESGTAVKHVETIEQADDGTYSAYVPDLPGCTTSGDSVEAVKQSIGDAVATYIESLREHDEPVPPPSAQADVVEAA